MEKTSKIQDLNLVLDNKICWYGPKSTDISAVVDLLPVSGTVCCYKDSCVPAAEVLSPDRQGQRAKISIDNLAQTLVSTSELPLFFKEKKIQAVLPYDTNPALELFCARQHIMLLSSKDELKDRFRDKTKIDEISYLVDVPAIPGTSGVIDDFSFEPLAAEFGLPLFLHFANGAGGTGNRIVYTFEQFNAVKSQMRGQKLNVKKFFVGKSCSIDICVTPGGTLCGPLEEMVIGAYPLNTNPTEYVASSWFANGYSLSVRKRVLEIGQALGALLRSEGFVGCFHPDFLIGEDDEIHLTELNMRFGGSCGVYSEIQRSLGQLPFTLTHALCFLQPDLSYDVEAINRANLKPLDFALMIMKNTSANPVRVTPGYPSGLYELSGNQLVLKEANAPFDHLADTHSFLLRCLPNTQETTYVAQGALLCEVVTRFPISNSNSDLNQRGRELAALLYDQLIVRE